MEMSGIQTVAHLSFGKGHPVPTEEQALYNIYLKKNWVLFIHTHDTT